MVDRCWNYTAEVLGAEFDIDNIGIDEFYVEPILNFPASSSDHWSTGKASTFSHISL